MWRPTRNRDVANPRAIGDECEAFLRGLWVDYLVENRALVPPAARLNRLAHGTPQEIRTIGRGERPERDQCTWNDTVRYLALELDDSANGDDATIAELQRTVLVPLELDLIRSPEPQLTPGRLAARVLRALGRGQNTRR